MPALVQNKMTGFIYFIPLTGWGLLLLCAGQGRLWLRKNQKSWWMRRTWKKLGGCVFQDLSDNPPFSEMDITVGKVPTKVGVLAFSLISLSLYRKGQLSLEDCGSSHGGKKGASSCWALLEWELWFGGWGNKRLARGQSHSRDAQTSLTAKGSSLGNVWF